MRIAWLTPFNPRSAVGDYSEVIVDELARTNEVVLFSSEQDNTLPRPSRHPVVRLPAQLDQRFLAQLDTFDLRVYNMSNCLPYHATIFEASLQRPGVVILHDLVLRDFFIGYALLHRRDPEYLVRLLAYSHGQQGELQGRDLLAGRRVERLEDAARLRFPLFRPALQRCQGVIVHSEYAQQRVREVCQAPVVKLEPPVCGPAAALVAAPPPPRPSQGKIRLLSFGLLNPNKLVHSTILTIARNAFLRQNVTFTVIGEGTEAYRRTLEKLIQQNNLQQTVLLTGYRSDEELRTALADSDIVVHLRNPHLGESSASLIDSLVAGIPTIVWNHGFYAEFPDDVVCKISSEAQLGTTLERLVRHPNLRKQMGEAAREHALGRFKIQDYARNFHTFVDEVRSQRPFLALTDRVSDYLLEMGSGPLDDLATRLSEEIAGLLGETPDILPMKQSPSSEPVPFQQNRRPLKRCSP